MAQLVELPLTTPKPPVQIQSSVIFNLLSTELKRLDRDKRGRERPNFLKYRPRKMQTYSTIWSENLPSNGIKNILLLDWFESILHEALLKEPCQYFLERILYT